MGGQKSMNFSIDFEQVGRSYNIYTFVEDCLKLSKLGARAVF